MSLLDLADGIAEDKVKGYKMTYSAEGDTTGIVMLTKEQAELVARVINTDNWLACKVNGLSGVLEIDLDNPMTDSEVKAYTEKHNAQFNKQVEEVKTLPSKIDACWAVLSKSLASYLEPAVKGELKHMTDSALEQILNSNYDIPADYDIDDLRKFFKSKKLYPNEIVLFSDCIRIGAYKFVVPIESGAGFAWDSNWEFSNYFDEDRDADDYSATASAITESGYKFPGEIESKRRVHYFGLYLNWLLFLKSCYKSNVVKSYYTNNKRYLRFMWWSLIKGEKAYKDFASTHTPDEVFRLLDTAEEDWSALKELNDIYSYSFEDTLDKYITGLNNTLLWSNVV